MSRLTPLWDTPELQVRRFDHAHAGHAHDDAEEVAGQYIISVVERGRFLLHCRGQSWELGPGDVMLSRPGMEFRVQHPDHDYGDVCLSLCLADASVEAADAQRVWPASRPPVLRAADRIAYLHWALLRAVRDAQGLHADACAADWLEALAVPPRTAPRPFRPHTLRWHAERVQTARERLDAEPAAEHRLVQLARDAAMSPFQFARVFERLVGLPPHRYLLRARLRRAAAMLDAGSRVTDACYACGFNHPAHFTRLFRREFGALPSHCRGVGAGAISARNCKREGAEPA